MIAVKRLVDSSGKQFYLVESRLPDPLLQCIIGSEKFRCNSRGFEDSEARTKALRFAITTETLPQFREFIFSEGDAAATVGRIEGATARLDTLSSVSSVGTSQDGLKRKIRSYVCMRQNRLTGLRFVVAMSRLENGRLRAISFQDHSIVGAEISDEALHKAVRFLRGVAFEAWRKLDLSELTSREREAAGQGRERALKHVSSFVEIEAGEKVDCACGKNRSRGLMVACENCGTWEHAECQGFRSDKQIPADYHCTACMRTDREDVVVIRLDEQGECGNLQLEDLWTEAKIRDRDADDVCCVCGCEDNQDFEAMIHPVNDHVCDGGVVLAHPACITAAQNLSHKAWNGKAMAAGMCQLCGDRFLKSPVANEELFSHTSSGVTQSKSHKGPTSPSQSQNRNPRRATKSEQPVRQAKRLRSALTNGVSSAKVEVPEKRLPRIMKEEESQVHASQSGEKLDLTSSEANKVGTALLGRRFNDPAVTVPIKKRRLQMIEPPKSPSPPPRSPSPPPRIDVVGPKKEQMDDRGLKQSNMVVQMSEDLEMVDAADVSLLEEERNKQNSQPSSDDRNSLHSERVSDAKSADRLSERDVAPVSSISESAPKELNPSLGNSGLDRVDVDPSHAVDAVRYSDVVLESTKVTVVGPTSDDKMKSVENGVRDLKRLSMPGGQDGYQKERSLHEEPLLTILKRAPHIPDMQESSGGSEYPIRAVMSSVASNLFESQKIEAATKDAEIAGSRLSHALDTPEKDNLKKESNTEKTLPKVVQSEEASQLPDVDNKDTGASSSASQSRSRDVRLHWDLNMDMEEWERPPEEDTGTFSGVHLGLDSNVSHCNDVHPATEHIMNPSVEHDLVSSGKVEVTPIIESKPQSCHESDVAMEDHEFEGECFATSTDAGSVPSKHRVGIQGSEVASKGQTSKGSLDLRAGQVQEPLLLQGMDFVESEASGAHSSSKVLFMSSSMNLKGAPDSLLHLSKRSELDGDEKLPKGEEGHAGMSNRQDGVLDLPKDYGGLNVVVDSKSIDGGEMSGEDGRNGPCSPSASFVELGEKSPSDADFSGTSELTKGKMDVEGLHTGGDSSVEETANHENQVVSVDNYDFVEYEVTDEEDERAHVVESAVPEKSNGQHNVISGQAAGSQDWNEDPVEEAEHVDYDDSDFRDGDEAGSEAEERVESEWRDNGRQGPSEQAVGVKRGGEVELIRETLVRGAGDDHAVESSKGLIAIGEVAASGSGDGDFHLRESVRDVDVGDKKSDTILQTHNQEENVNLAGDGSNSHSGEKVEIVVHQDEKLVEEEKEDFTPGSSTRRQEGQARSKSSGWDQLPKGFDKAEDALRAAKENPASRAGRGSPWGTANGRGASISPRSGPQSNRFGRGGGRAEGVGDRTRLEDNTWTREGHPRAQRVDESVDMSPRITSPRELGRGRSHGRGASPAVRGRGRMEPWLDSPAGPSSPWAPNRHPSPPGRFGDGFGPRAPTNAAAMAAAKVESSGFVVAPDGTVTKAGNSARGPPRPFQGGGRNGRGVMFNMGRGGGPGMNVGVGINMGGLRVNIGMGRGMGMGPGMTMNMGMGMGMVGPGLGVGIPGRGGPGGRGMGERYNGPYGVRSSSGNSGVDHSSSSRRGRSHEDYSDSWSRREDRSASPRRRRSTSRRSRSRSLTPSRSNSRSKTGSPPRARSPPKSGNSSGGGGGVLGKTSRKRSQSPGSYKPELKMERGESPSHRFILPPPKLPLPPPPPRNQRSPPAGLKRLSDNKKDGDRARSRDRERERERERERATTTRARSPPRRTSPHVVHGSALMDERDRQLLAGIRHVSPVTLRNRSSEAPGPSIVATSRDSPSLASPVGRIVDGSIEARRQSGEEAEENRVHAPKRDETSIKVEQRMVKEISRGDRERFSRRDGGRDDERRDVSKSIYNSRDRDGRSSSSLKYNREGDDDVAPRRRRPSP